MLKKATVEVAFYIIMKFVLKKLSQPSQLSHKLHRVAVIISFPC